MCGVISADTIAHPAERLVERETGKIQVGNLEVCPMIPEVEWQRPFLELPDEVELVRQDHLDEDGINGCIFTLRAISAGEGVLRVGFRDLRTGNIVIEKSIQVKSQ